MNIDLTVYKALKSHDKNMTKLNIYSKSDHSFKVSDLGG